MEHVLNINSCEIKHESAASFTLFFAFSADKKKNKNGKNNNECQ